MRQQILQKVYDSNWLYSKLDAKVILDSLEKNRPNIEIISNQINQRSLLYDPFTNNKNLACLQLKVFDKKDNCQKVIEIFSTDLLKQYMDTIIFYSKQSKYLIKTDWLLQVHDSYYLDEDNFFYAIEYEYFDFSIHEVYFEFQNQSEQLLDHYLCKASQYCKQALQMNNKNYNSISIDKIKLLYFVLQYQQDGTKKIKLNTVEPFMYQNPSIFLQLQEQLPKKKFVIQYVGNLDNTFKAIIKKESLSQVIKNIIQEEQGNFEEITKNILDRTQLDEFAIFSFQPGKDSAVLHLEGTNLTKSIQFNIQKINQKELFQEKLQEKNALIQQLKQLNIKVLDHFQEFSTCEGDFFVEYVDLSQRNGLFPLIQSKNQFFEEVNKQYSSLADL